MADINITGQGTFAANSYTVPTPQVVGTTTVSFHSASQNCKVCFGNQATFNMSSVIISTGPPQAITLEAVQGTSFTVVGENDSCGGIRETIYNITMGSGMPGPKKPRAAKKVAVKTGAAKKSSGRKRAGAKKKASAKKKAASKKKTGGKKKAARKRK